MFDKDKQKILDEVVHLAGEGKTDQQIAKELWVSSSEVSAYRNLQGIRRHPGGPTKGQNTEFKNAKLRRSLLMRAKGYVFSITHENEDAKWSTKEAKSLFEQLQSIQDVARPS